MAITGYYYNVRGGPRAFNPGLEVSSNVYPTLAAALAAQQSDLAVGSTVTGTYFTDSTTETFQKVTGGSVPMTQLYDPTEPAGVYGNYAPTLDPVSQQRLQGIISQQATPSIPTPTGSVGVTPDGTPINNGAVSQSIFRTALGGGASLVDTAGNAIGSILGVSPATVDLVLWLLIALVIWRVIHKIIKKL